MSFTEVKIVAYKATDVLMYCDNLETVPLLCLTRLTEPVTALMEMKKANDGSRE